MDKIVPSFKKSLFDSSKEVIGDITELGIDSLLDDGLFKDLPVVNLLIGVKKTAQNLHDRNLLKQALNFIKEFNSGTINEEKLKNYKEKINSNPNKAEEDLGRVLIILNSNIELEKSKMLANLYRNYINGNIIWSEFSEIIRQLFLSDINYLEKIYEGKIKNTVTHNLYAFNRLLSLGLINTSPKGLYPIDPEGSYSREEKFVQLSKIGGKFYQSIILN